jgi:PBSX family phage terminase large subunit
MDINIDLNNLICNNFVDVASDIINCDINRAVLNGGRASTKSQVASECIITGCMVYNESAVACVRYANKIQERLVNTFTESIRYMGLEQFWKLRKSPFEYVLLDENGKETDVSIKFTGCDNPEDLKSYKPRRGGFRYIWFEELTNHNSLKDVNNLIQTFSRGKTHDDKKCVIMTYNPPMQNSNWVNKEFNHPSNKDNIIYSDDKQWKEYFDFEIEPGKVEKLIKTVHHSTYLDVIANGHADWLGSDFIGEAKRTEVENNKYYRWAYLGEVIGTEANVFSNIHDWDGDTSKLDITEIFRGLDFGLGGPDPSAFVAWYYDRANKRIYALNEFAKPKMSIDDMAFEIKQLNKHNFPVYSDSATPILTNELVNKGLNIVGAIKGPDSIAAGIKWLQSLNGIYICNTLTPSIYGEFTEYEYLVDKNDNVTSKLKDSGNHTIDATRYSFNLEIKYAA